MWISEQLLASGTTRPAGERGRFITGETVQGQAEYRGVPQAGPWGIYWQAPAGAQAVLVQTDSGPACLALSQAANLQPGELLLRAQGGASIYLKNNGQVLINGVPYPEEAG